MPQVRSTSRSPTSQPARASRVSLAVMMPVRLATVAPAQNDAVAVEGRPRASRVQRAAASVTAATPGVEWGGKALLSQAPARIAAPAAAGSVPPVTKPKYRPAVVTVHAHREGANPVIDVTDRGPGIPEGAAAQLFRPFYTTSEHGTGLGLYIARELCHANGARLDYLPRGAATGSCFRITLPAANALLQN